MKKYLILLSLFCLCFTIGCKKDVTELQNDPVIVLPAKDQYLRAFSSALNMAIRENPSMVSVIKAEVQNKYDGDYDVLFDRLSNCDVNLPLTKGSSDKVTFGELIERHLAIPGDVRSSTDVLAQIQEEYPGLQISVPVHADMLSEEAIPPVVFIPTELSETEIEYLEGFDRDGNLISIDAIEAPDEAVIVIGQSERLHIPLDPYAPLAPDGLVATRSSDSIILTWNSVSGSSGYDVYRKAQGESSFTCVGSPSGQNSISYEDTQISATLTYSYYVVTRALVDNGDLFYEATSGPSIVVTVNAPSVLPALNSFSVECEGNHLKIRWLNEGITNCDINLSYYDPRWSDPTPQLIATVNGSSTNSYNFTPSSTMKGHRLVFEANRTNSVGNSDTVYDIVYPPFRNVEDFSPVKLTKIDMVTEENMNHLEHWYRGAPEFYIKIIGVNSNGVAQELVDQIEVRFSGRNVAETFDRNLYYWLYDHYYGWYSALRFYIEEGDNDATYSFSATAKLGFKVGKFLDFSLGGSFTANFSTSGQNCGFIDMLYYENPVLTRETQQEQLRVSFSD